MVLVTHISPGFTFRALLLNDTHRKSRWEGCESWPISIPWPGPPFLMLPPRVQPRLSSKGHLNFSCGPQCGFVLSYCSRAAQQSLLASTSSYLAEQSFPLNGKAVFDHRYQRLKDFQHILVQVAAVNCLAYGQSFMRSELAASLSRSMSLSPPGWASSSTAMLAFVFALLWRSASCTAMGSSHSEVTG